MAGLLLAVVLAACGEAPSQPPVSPPPKSADQVRLELEKLRQEVRKLELENERASSWQTSFLAWAPFGAALIAVLGTLVTLHKQIDETSARRQQEIKQREQEVHQREQESLRRFDERFTAVVENLGSDSIPLQASAAASLMTFLRSRYQEFHEDVFLLLVAHLKIGRDRAIGDLLTRVFEKAVRLELEQLDIAARLAEQQGKEAPRVSLDLARTYLARADLGGLDFTGLDLDIAFATLSGANFSDAKLWRVRGFGADLERARFSRADLEEAGLNEAHARRAMFHGANLVSARLKGADLREAQFFQARLQSAHLEGALLQGARFQEANLNDAFFRNASLDSAAKHSITRALHWQKAHFDDATAQELREIART